jgi:UDP-N-acetylglucosamine 2-epimerase (non-hydrolysing)/GDP/UDP-N,N'-diacetylbacillosamine 2-epimerase (hydrolysing)
MRRRKICVVTGSRADYSHLYGVMKAIQGDQELDLKVVATGMHVSPRFGRTYRHIERDGFRVDEKVPLLRYSDSAAGITKSIGLGCRLFADVFERMKPDMVVVLGDRFEIFSAAIAAYVAGIPLAHLHGGETTQGAVDEGMRHAITKMATWHFAATETYRKRIIQLGEEPGRVFHFGAPILDSAKRIPLLTREALAKALHFDLTGRVAIVTYHPPTLEKNPLEKQVESLLRALARFPLKAVFTQSNADTGGGKINRAFRAFSAKRPERYKFVRNLGWREYVSALAHFDLVVGNSSSGLIEAPSFKIPVVNIGDRQKGRIRAANVIDVGPSASEIERGIRLALSPRFRRRLEGLRNPYEPRANGATSRLIKDKLKELPVTEAVLKKEFYDVSFAN